MLHTHEKTVAFGTPMRFYIFTSLSIFDLAVYAASNKTPRTFDPKSCALTAGLIPPLVDQSSTIPYRNEASSDQPTDPSKHRPRHRIALTGPGPNAILSLHLMAQRLQEQDGVDRRDDLVSILNNAVSCEEMVNSLRVLLELKSETLPADNFN